MPSSQRGMYTKYSTSVTNINVSWSSRLIFFFSLDVVLSRLSEGDIILDDKDIVVTKKFIKVSRRPAREKYNRKTNKNKKEKKKVHQRSFNTSNYEKKDNETKVKGVKNKKRRNSKNPLSSLLVNSSDYNTNIAKSNLTNSPTNLTNMNSNSTNLASNSSVGMKKEDDYANSVTPFGRKLWVSTVVPYEIAHKGTLRFTASKSFFVFIITSKHSNLVFCDLITSLRR